MSEMIFKLEEHKHSGLEVIMSGAANACPICQAFEIAGLRQQLEAKEKACAEMRQVLKQCRPHREEFLNSESFEDFSDEWNHALSSDCGKDYVPKAELDSAQKRIAELERLLSELFAEVRGECPSLLNEDSGGNGRLSVEIEDALKHARKDLGNSNYWGWQGDGEDHLESLVCPVLIRPEALLKIITELEAAQKRIEELENNYLPTNGAVLNSIAYKLGLLTNEVGTLGPSIAGDEIDRGLILIRRLKESGYLIAIDAARVCGNGGCTKVGRE